MKSSTARLVLLAAATGLSLLAGEAALRIVGFSHPNFYRPDAERGWSLRPGVQGPWRQEGRSQVAINRAGMRDEEHPEAKPAGVLRIAVLGDSCAEALQVEHEETFAELLERDLASCPALAGRKVEALNFGVSGYGTAQELLTLRQQAWRYQPDVVLLAFYPGNDVANNSRALDGNRQRPYFVPSPQEAAPAGSHRPKDHRPKLALDASFREDSGFRFRTSLPGRLVYGLADRSRLLQLAKPARVAWRRWRADRKRQAPAASTQGEAGLDDEVYREPQDDRWRAAWAVTEELIRTMDDEARAHRARLGVAVLTSGVQVHPDPAVRRAYAKRLGVPNLLYPDRRIAALGRAAGFPVISLTPALAERATRERVFFHGFPNTAMGLGHWNTQGHRAAAELLVPWLCRELAAAPGGTSP